MTLEAQFPFPFSSLFAFLFSKFIFNTASDLQKREKEKGSRILRMSDTKNNNNSYRKTMHYSGKEWKRKGKGKIERMNSDLGRKESKKEDLHLNSAIDT